MNTLPRLCELWGEPLDLARTVIRKTPALKSLGRRLGPTRVYDSNEAETIRAALVARRQAKERAGVTA